MSLFSDIFGGWSISMPPPPALVKATPDMTKAIATQPNEFQAFDLYKGMAAAEAKALANNPMMLLDAMGYKQKPGNLSYQILSTMATRNAVVAAIILTRVNQVATFTKPARFSRDGLGYEIKTRDPEHTPTDEEKDLMLAMELFLENCGFDEDNSRDDFTTFIKKLVRDSLTYDQACVEVVPDKAGRPAELFAVDAATIRAATETFDPSIGLWQDLQPPKKNQEVSWVQVIDGRVTAWFTNQELAFGVRNPRTNINMNPYGFSELEQLIHQITSHLYAEEYNMRFFSQGGTSKGILNIKGQYQAANKEQIDGFKRQWKAQVSGLSGAWKTPILQVPDGIEYINVGTTNREMEFEKWMNYLINVSCAVFQIDPAEVNFPNNGGVGGSGGGIFESGNLTKLQNSKDKGLRPLLRFIEDFINKYIISRFSNQYVFSFVGVDAKTDSEIVDLDQKSVHVYKTVNEIRKEHDMGPLEDGDTILDPSFINMVNQKKMMEQQQSMMGGGAPGEEGEEMPPDEAAAEAEDDQEVNPDEEEFDYGFDDTDVDDEFADEELEESEEESEEKKGKTIKKALEKINTMEIYID